MAWLIGICLGVVVLMGWALCLASSRADDQVEDWLAEADGSELDLSAVSPEGSRPDPDFTLESSPVALHAVLEDLHRRAAERQVDLQQSAEARRRYRPHRPFWTPPTA